MLLFFKASQDYSAVSKLFRISFHFSRLVLFSSSVYFVFSPIASFNLFSVTSFCLPVQSGQSQGNDNIHSFSGQISSAATCAHTNTLVEDERSRDKGVNMIRGSFLGVSRARASSCLFTQSQLYCISEMYSFVNTLSYNARWIPPLALCKQQKLLHCLNVNNKKECREH